MMQDAMRRWRHLGLGLVAAKERLALTSHAILVNSTVLAIYLSR